MARKIHWPNTIFLILSPVIVAIFVPLDILKTGLQVKELLLFLILSLASSLSITAGYHRLFAHRSYEAAPWLKMLYLLFGASAVQGSAQKWCTDHRRHHQHVDTDKDPYSIKKGFFYAHIGWIFLQEEPEYAGKFSPDLAKDKMMAWQNKYYWPLVGIMGFLFPMGVGALWGDAWGGLLFGGFARVVFTHHCTFFINSLCHFWGSQPYEDRNTARDNFVMAFLTYGEGYHNFHHRFQMDYRNGVRWYQWDPTKWWIRVWSWLGSVRNLRKVSETEILKARLAQEEKNIQRRGFYSDRIQLLKVRVEETGTQWLLMKAKYRQMKREFQSSNEQRVAQFKLEMKLARIEFRLALAQWRTVVRSGLAFSPSI